MSKIDKQPLVSIILLNYNGAKDTIECIESINKISYSNYNIVVVDNNSTDNSVELIKKKCLNIKLIESKKNGGFAYGNNIAIEYALKNEADFVLLLNNDTIVEKEFLSTMMNTCINRKIDVLGCKINYFNERHKSWYLGGSVNWNKFYGEHIKKSLILNVQEVDFITGCCMLLSKKVVKQILLPEEYFMYFEDVDFCIQLKDNGFQLMVDPAAVIYHKVSASSGGEESPFFIKYWNRNRIIFMNKYKTKVSIRKYFMIQIKFYLSRIIKYFIYLFLRQEKERKSMVLGIKEGIRFIKSK